jgi:protein-disulfide isomerase
MRITPKCVFLWLALVSLSRAAPTDSDTSSITAVQADKIITELTQIRTLLMRSLDMMSNAGLGRARTESRVVVMEEGGRVLGSATAPVTIVEFTDYECPFCNRFFMDTFGTLKRKYIDPGLVRFVHRDLPLDIHEHALGAAQAAQCAADQDRFWEMRERLSARPKELETEKLLSAASELGLDVTAFTRCLTTGKYVARIKADIEEARRLGVTGTPALVVGKIIPGGVNGQLMVGAVPLPVIEGKVESLLHP